MSDVRSVFMGQEAATQVAEHERRMRELREQRGKIMNGALAIVIMCAAILIIFATIYGCAKLLQLAF